MNTSLRSVIVTLAVPWLLTACEKDAVETKARWTDKALPSSVPVPARWYQDAQVATGAKLFRRYCAQCHGAEAEGEEDWQGLQPNGTRPPPPLNGAGHAWNHPVSELRDSFMRGSHGEQSKIPEWQDKLGDEDALAVVAWMQSRWPEAIYAQWHGTHHHHQGH
ncbi:MAG: c-type cytochrome [Gammaproteobacteria bacterium]